jgi:hypothetical protein
LKPNRAAKNKLKIRRSAKGLCPARFIDLD